VIQSIRHASLRRLWQRREQLPPEHPRSIRRARQLIDSDKQPADLRGALRAKHLASGPWAKH